MPDYPIGPEHFLGENPPERLMGAECEYNAQNVKGKPMFNNSDVFKLISNKAIKAAGYNRVVRYLDNGSKLHEDQAHIEYAAAESSGALQAAAADMAGISVVQNVVTASEEEHGGIYRISGSSMYKAEKGADTTIKTHTTQSNGYHQSFMIPESIARDPLLDQLLPAFLVSTVWAMGGMIHREQYVHSQKLWGINNESKEHVIRGHGNHRTSHGSKPMVTIHCNDNDTVGIGKWARVEVRLGDPGLSPKARYLLFAATSLVLRLVEQKSKIDVESIASTVALKDAKQAGITYAQDLTMRVTGRTEEDQQLSWPDIQETFFEGVTKLSEKIELPPSEAAALPIWSETIDGFRQSEAENGEYPYKVLTISDTAAKHRWLMRRYGSTAIKKRDPAAIRASINWDRVLPSSTGMAYWSAVDDGTVPKDMIESLVHTAPNTRAAIRATAIKEIVENGTAIQHGDIDWAGLKRKPFSDPFGYIAA